MTEKQETTYSMEQRAKLWAVGGGKGGVGKSFLTTNIGVLLAKEGKRVVLMDLDLGGANLHTCLGVTDLDRGVSDFLMRRYEELEEAMIDSSSKFYNQYNKIRTPNLHKMKPIPIFKKNEN